MIYKGFYIGLISIILAITVLNIASAEIIINQPSPLYNIGDEFSFSLSINLLSDANDYLTGKIVCENGEVEIYKTPFNIKASESKNVTIRAKLDKALINSLSGLCYLKIDYGSEEAKSQQFELSNKINVNLFITNSILEPGQKFVLSGTAKKINGIAVNGFLESSISEINSSVKTQVINGEFKADFSIPLNTQAGPYSINARVYEKESSGADSNEGFASASIRIKQIIKKIDMAFNTNSLKPENDLLYSVLLYDQSGSEAKLDSDIVIYNAKGEVFSKKLIKSGESNSLKLEADAIPGYWTIESSYNDLSNKKSFYVEEVEKASFVLINQTLMVKNTGNIKYEKNVEILIGNKNEIKKLNLNVGEEKKFRLFAPVGEYVIAINEGNSKLILGSSYLTGKAIEVKELGEIVSGGNTTKILIWISIILILLLVLTLYSKKIKDTSFTALAPSHSFFSSKKKYLSLSQPNSEEEPEPEKTERPEKSLPESTSQLLPITPIAPITSAPLVSPIKNAIPAYSDNKIEAVVLALKIKNSAKLKASQSNAFLAIEHAFQKAKTIKAKIYEKEEFRLIIFTQKLTKRADNLETAVKIAYQIDSKLKEYNKKYAIKIDYGLGANIGLMFFEMIEGRPKFTSIGNTLVLAKNIAERANNELLISGPLYRKVHSFVKTEHTPYGLYKINSIVETEQHSEFINKFMKRNKT